MRRLDRPIALCGFLQEKYSSLVTEKAWPAVSATLPEGNNVAIDAHTDGIKRCFHCQGTDHLRDTCPKLGRGANHRNVGGRRDKTGGTGGTTEGGTDSATDTNTPTTRSPFPAWRYIEPVDKTSAIMLGDHTYKWCSKCKCRATGKQGYFLLLTISHTNMFLIAKLLRRHLQTIPPLLR
jgi:hypothetical protein